MPFSEMCLNNRVACSTKLNSTSPLKAFLKREVLSTTKTIRTSSFPKCLKVNDICLTAKQVARGHAGCVRALLRAWMCRVVWALRMLPKNSVSLHNLVSLASKQYNGTCKGCSYYLCIHAVSGKLEKKNSFLFEEVHVSATWSQEKKQSYWLPSQIAHIFLLIIHFLSCNHLLPAHFEYHFEWVISDNESGKDAIQRKQLSALCLKTVNTCSLNLCVHVVSTFPLRTAAAHMLHTKCKWVWCHQSYWLV